MEQGLSTGKLQPCFQVNNDNTKHSKWPINIPEKANQRE
jgi:hypothetical protein